MRLRWLLLIPVVVVLGAVATLPAWVPRLAGHRAVSVGQAQWCRVGLCLGEVEREGVRAARVEVYWDRSVHLHDVRVDLATLKVGGASGGGGGAAGWTPRVEVEGLRVEGAPFELPALSGELLPERHLAGEGVTLDGDTVRATLPTDFGEVEVEARPGPAGVEVVARCAACRFASAALAETPLELPPLEVRATVAGDRVVGTATMEGWSVAVDGVVHDGAVKAEIRAEALPVAALYTLLRDAVPEMRRADVQGELSFVAKVTWPDVTLAVEPALTGFHVRGVLPPGFASGRFTWATRTAEGDPVRRTGGEGTSAWMPLAEMGEILPMAVVAAEDGQFWGHPGYDLAGMLAAARDNEERGETWRGGSTLTQQLAKNLFLDGTRTYARKLRELLYAVEMEQRLGKPRILELYLNIVEWGPGIYGARAASEVYFLKKPAGLLPEEAAWMATILPRPRSAWSSEYLKGRPTVSRVSTVLDHMRALPDAERDAAKAREIHFVPP